MVDDLEVLFFHAAEIDLLDMDEPQQLANRLGHRAAAFVTRAAALCYADPRPEFLLVRPRRLRISRGLTSSSSFMFAPVPLEYGNAYASSMERAKAEIHPPKGSADPYACDEFAIKFNDFFRGRNGADRTKIRRDFAGHDGADQGRRR